MPVRPQPMYVPPPQQQYYEYSTSYYNPPTQQHYPQQQTVVQEQIPTISSGDFSCCICTNLLTNAVLIPCGRSICHLCHTQWKGQPCSNCNLVHEAAWPNTIVRNIILKLFPYHNQPSLAEQNNEPLPREEVIPSKKNPGVLNFIEGSR